MGIIMDSIRRAIETSGVSRYRLGKDLGIDKGQLSRVMAGKMGLSVENVEKIAEYLGIEIRFVKRRRSGKGR